MVRQILVVEDNEALAKILALHLSDLDANIEVAGDGVQGLQMAGARAYDIIILDLILPGVDGLEICRRLRAGGTFTPILMLTSRSSELDRIRGLAVGADDYLTKPFSVPELLARVKAMLRRRAIYDVSGEQGLETLDFGALAIDVPARIVTIADNPISLTAREFDLLLHFARAPGRVFTRTELLDSVWGHSHDAYEHTVNSHINRLRAKIEPDPGQPALHRHGVGCRLQARCQAPDAGRGCGRSALD